MANLPFLVTVPASTSNLGSGFDTVSAALSLHLKVSVTPNSRKGVSWSPSWKGREKENIMARALERTLKILDVDRPSLKIHMENPIPLRRGLGSSGAAVLAGIKIAEHLSGRTLSTDQILQIGYPLEGHPENLAASLLGGWVISRTGPGGVQSERINSPLKCRFVVATPETTVSTQEARQALPKSYALPLVVFNLQRCALLVHALHSGRKELLEEALDDAIHTPHRACLVPGIPSLLTPAQRPGELQEHLLGVCISGSGSCVLALADGSCEEIGEWMVETLAENGTRAHYQVLDLDTEGARIDMVH